MSITNIHELHEKIMEAKKRGFVIHKMLKEINVAPRVFYANIKKAGLNTWDEIKPSGVVSSDEIKLPEKMPVWWNSDKPKKQKRKKPCAVFVVQGKMLPKEFSEDLMDKI